MILRPTQIWRYLVVLLCVCVVLFHTDTALCETKSQAVHGSWVIALEAAKKEDLKAYFEGNDEQDLLAKASSAIFTFDVKKMRFIRSVLGKETIYRIRRIAKSQNHPDSTQPETLELWLEQVKFPDYILVLPDGRLRYGSTYGRPWEFLLQRK